jgi:23S rRNA pseudouridine1911/1915/1917 synthase
VSDQELHFEFGGGNSLRLDRYLAEVMEGFSRSRIQGLIRDGFVCVDQQTIVKTAFPLEAGMEIQVRVPAAQPSELQAENIPLDVLFENEDVMVINKPAGMVVHPAAGHDSGTLVQAALGHAPELEGISGEQRPGVVHRLDKDTSGIILMAKNDRSHHWLQDQFRLRKVKKVYLALVDGHPPTPSGRVEAPIGRDPVHRKEMAIVRPDKGREAITEYKVIENFADHALVEAYPQTGRTHQIRLHLAFIGCPIVGDLVYGHRKASVEIERHFLHAIQISVTLPGEKMPRTFRAELPDELQKVLIHLRRG